MHKSAYIADPQAEMTDPLREMPASKTAIWEVIQSQVGSLITTASHYRKEHAPLRQYITNETNEKKMHASNKYSYETTARYFQN